MEGIPEILAQYTVQLVSMIEDLPGFALPDRPIVHGKRREGVFGFEEAGAIGDADIIIVPISRRLLGFYSARELPHVTIRTNKGLAWVNALLIHNAENEVACHPHDVLATARLIRNLERYPPSKFDSVSIR